MKRIILSIFVILTALVFSVSAQTAAQKAFEKGMKAAGSRDFSAALAHFKKSLALTENETAKKEILTKIHFNIGVCLYRLERAGEAVPEFERAIELTKGDYEKAFYALAMAQFELKNWSEAERAFLRAIRLNERNGETWFDLAFVYLAKNDLERARTAFQKSIEYKSVDSAIGHNNLGVIFALTGDVASAVREFEAALKESGGKLAEAERNLQFCKALGQTSNRDLLAELEFIKSGRRNE